MTIITFLSDFGTDDVFVGLCHAAVARIAPDARVLDLTHAVPRQDVRTGAVRLADCVAHADADVHLAVVDPGVGTSRAPVVLETPGPPLVGPDNGLLMPAAARLGGVRRAWEITAYPLGRGSSTFHGRDVFAPAAAALAGGVAPERLGRAVDCDRLVDLRLPPARVHRGEVRTTVRDVDVYGNVQLGAEAGALDDAGIAGGTVVVTGPRRVTARRVATFDDLADEVGLLSDSFGWLALVLRRGDAAVATGLGRGDTVTLTAATR